MKTQHVSRNRRQGAEVTNIENDKTESDRFASENRSVDLVMFLDKINSIDHQDLTHPFPAEEELSTDLFLLGIASWLGGLWQGKSFGKNKPGRLKVTFT